MNAEIASLVKRLPGSWRLPNRLDESVAVTFYPDGNFGWTVSAYSAWRKTIQIGTGPFWRGNWQIRPTKWAPKVVDYSRYFAWAGRETCVDVLDAVGMPLPHQAPPTMPLAIEGPFLVMNFTDLSQSILNLCLFGFRLDLANWLNNVAEVFRDGNVRIVEFADDRMTIEPPERRPETWYRV